MIPNKTDKQLVWEAIKHIEDYTSDVHPTFDILPETLWKEYPKEDRLRIRALLLSEGLASVLDNQHWAFRLTAAGMLLKESDLKDNGTLNPKKSYKQFWIGVLATGIGAVLSTILSAGLEVWKSHNLPQSQQNIVVRPKVQVLHDTIWLETRKILPKKR